MPAPDFSNWRFATVIKKGGGKVAQLVEWQQDVNSIDQLLLLSTETRPRELNKNMLGNLVYLALGKGKDELQTKLFLGDEDGDAENSTPAKKHTWSKHKDLTDVSGYDSESVTEEVPSSHWGRNQKGADRAYTPLNTPNDDSVKPNTTTMPVDEDASMASEPGESELGSGEATGGKANSGKPENPEPLVTPDFKKLTRLAKNMQGPKEGCHADWNHQNATFHLRFSKSERFGQNSVSSLSEERADLFFKLERGLPFVTEEEISNFRANFAVGSGSLEHFIDFMNSVYEMFEHETLPLHHLHSEAYGEYTLLRSLPSTMLALLRYLRGIIPRHEYDPMGGFRSVVN
ncbi:hypothetical protein K435DRAFT_871097 [Dendrothele bispora CBS 962.96]|uniref:Uncharacterized protein n=1 Tax=Dendrothele bispora (strain CBS 962.96) TaxID=1314807 RepID=A0A4S8L4X0_DENBC|nr:hypothetical protein K435DRAFT_871097 [Dendrothele bispora CBS 962.96]